MADTKISNLNALAEAPATGDLLALVDVSASETKKLTIAYLIDAVEGNANTFTVAQTITPGSNAADIFRINNAAGIVLLSLNSTNGRLGLGISAPTSQLHAISDSQAGLTLNTAGDTASTASVIFLTRSRGSNASPTIVSDGDTIGSILFRGYNTALATSAGIYAYADAEWGTAGDTTDNPGRIEFATVADGASSITTRMVIKNSGYIGINVTSPAAQLDIDQSSTSAAIPVLKLDQADVSEGFIDYIGTSAASAAGPISSWTTATIAGFVRCEINGVAYWQAYYNAPTS